MVTHKGPFIWDCYYYEIMYTYKHHTASMIVDQERSRRQNRGKKAVILTLQIADIFAGD